MKILVTGGVGFVGTNLIKKLLKENHEVVSIDNYYTGLKENEQPGCTYINKDIRNIEELDKDFDVIFHLAARARIQRSFQDPMETFNVNAYGTQVVAEFARKNNIKIVYAGSSSKWCNPETSPYATSKKLGEDILKMYRTSFDCDFEIARFYNVYGPHELVNSEWGAVIGIWRNQLAEGLPLTIVGDGDQRRDFTHVEDIADGLYRIALSEHKHEDAWELGTGKNHSINELYSFFKERYPEAESKYIDDLPGNYRFTLRQNDDTLDKLNWNPTDRLKEYITNL